ncbi:MAG: two-component regulator propeller domain-containing protein [Bacteroidia bacterium]
MKYVHQIFFIFLLATQCIAQPVNISFQHYNTESGLSSNLIRNIVQDKFGFLWMSTTDGLNRFDGKTFTIYRYNKNDSASISNNIINDICADNSGKIWVATNGGLCYYNYDDDAFHRITIDQQNAEPSDPKRIFAVSNDSNQRTWYITKTMLHSINPDGSITSYTVKRGESGEINSMLIDSENRIWIGTNRGKLLLFDRKNGSFKSYNVVTLKNANKKGLTITTVKIIEVRKNELLSGTWYTGLQHVKLKGDEVEISAYEDEQEADDRKWIVTGITKSNDAVNHFWVSHFGSGISMIDVATGKFIAHKRHDPADAKSLCNDFVNDVFTDNSGTLWVGTDEGLDKYDELSNRFSLQMIPEFNRSGTVRRQPAAIIENKNDTSHKSLWMSVFGAGLFLYSKTDGIVKSFHHTEEKNSLIGDEVNALYLSNKGKLWIGARTGVCTYDEKKNIFETLAFDTLNYKLNYIRTIIEDRKHRLWFASSRNGLFCYNPETGKLTAYVHNDSVPESLPDNHVFCILEDHYGRIWAGTQNNGLSRLNESTLTWTHFKHKPGTNNTIPENFIYELLEDKNNQLWIATENGLGVMDLQTENVTSYSSSDGLCNNDIFSIRKTSDNHLWLGTTNGLSDFNLSNKTFRNYFMMDGLPTNDIGGTFCKTIDGTIFIGVPGGIVYFNPTEIKSNSKIPAVAIASFSVFDKKYPIKRNGIQLEPIKLSYKQSMITFGFAALNFTNPTNNMYAYKLEGFDKDWIYCGNKTSATYTNLDGGDYLFKVKACNNDGVWNETGATVMLSVTPPFWKTIWFYCLVTIVIAIVLYAIYKIRINQILRMQHIRQRIARDLHDDIGSTLSSISMMSKMAAKNNSTAKENSNELFSTIGKASSQAMDLMSDIVWSVNPENDKMENIVARMREYASVILDAADISFQLEIDESTKHILLPMEKRKDFFLIFKEAVNNLAKYSQATEAQIKLSEKNHSLVMLIKDNGKGFDYNSQDVNGTTPLSLGEPARAGADGGQGVRFGGNGLKNMKARAEQLNAKFEITSQENNGTLISLSVPLVP